MSNRNDMDKTSHMVGMRMTDSYYEFFRKCAYEDNTSLTQAIIKRAKVGDIKLGAITEIQNIIMLAKDVLMRHEPEKLNEFDELEGKVWSMFS